MGVISHVRGGGVWVLAKLRLPVKELDQEIPVKPLEVEMIERLKASQMIQQKFQTCFKHV